MPGTPLEHLRVIDSCCWSGAYAAKLLADGGADVVRIVPPSGEALRAEPPFFGQSDVSIQDAWYNAGKRTLALDLDSPAGREALLRLVGLADILLEDWEPASPPFARDELQRANGKLAHVSITPMGATGPW